VSVSGNQSSLPALLVFGAVPTDRALAGWCPQEYLFCELEEAGLMEDVSTWDDLGAALAAAVMRGSVS
jgi:hypothetical protein